jgi:dTMP kinase
MTENKSLFIVIEGLDGSGKSSASKELAKVLDPKGKGIVKLTYEPNNDMCGGLFIREVLTKKIPHDAPSVLPLAYATNRLDHCHRLIRPWLEGDGHIVISDRYYLSSLVYQSRPDFPFEKIMLYNEYAIKPDVIFFINVDSHVCYERMKTRNQPEELFEANLDESRRTYLDAIDFLRKTHDENIIEIDGSGTISEVAAKIQAVIYKMAPYLDPSV